MTGAGISRGSRHTCPSCHGFQLTFCRRSQRATLEARCKHATISAKAVPERGFGSRSRCTRAFSGAGFGAFYGFASITVMPPFKASHSCCHAVEGFKPSVVSERRRESGPEPTAGVRSPDWRSRCRLRSPGPSSAWNGRAPRLSHPQKETCSP